MDDNSPGRLREAPATFRHDAMADLASSLRGDAVKRYRAKVFKSGNSLALRLPAALGLEAGMEMELLDQGGGRYALNRPDAPRRKIDVSRFVGKAPWLKELTPEDRDFEHRELEWEGRLLMRDG